MIVVVMEYCDMDTLLRAIKKKAFQPHGKWKQRTTYVRPHAGSSLLPTHPAYWCC